MRIPVHPLELLLADPNLTGVTRGRDGHITLTVTDGADGDSTLTLTDGMGVMAVTLTDADESAIVSHLILRRARRRGPDNPDEDD